MKSKTLISKQIIAAVAVLGAFGAAQGAMADDSVAHSNIAAIYAASGPSVGTDGGQNSDAVSLIDSKVMEWRDPSSVDLGLDTPTAAAAPAAEASADDNVALDNIRDIFNTYSDD